MIHFSGQDNMTHSEMSCIVAVRSQGPRNHDRGRPASLSLGSVGLFPSRHRRPSRSDAATCARGLARVVGAPAAMRPRRRAAPHPPRPAPTPAAPRWRCAPAGCAPRAAALSSAAGSYDKLPPNPLLMTYIASDAARRAFVDGMAEVQVKRGEIIMRQGARGARAALARRCRSRAEPARRARPARPVRAQGTRATTTTSSRRASARWSPSRRTAPSTACAGCPRARAAASSPSSTTCRARRR